MLGLLAAACGRVSLPGPPFHRAFTIDVSTPRSLLSFEETTVPVSLVNTGTDAWDPSRVHLSYHWLWLVPRELAFRSRTLPYHQGIRTELGAPVPPGGRVTVNGRILAPAVPGLYWLQWDMVEEGVTWFVQVSPRQPRHLVVILPTAVEFFAPLPPLVALLGLFALGRIERGRRIGLSLAAFAASADLIWCATTLVAKQILLVHDALLGPTAVAYWLMAVAAIAPLVVLRWILPPRARAWVVFVTGAVGTLLMMADIVYYRYFGDVISAPALLGAHQTGHVTDSIRSLLGPNLLWAAADLPLAFWLVVRLSRVSRAGWLARGRSHRASLAVMAALAVSGLALSAPTVLAATNLDQAFSNRAVAERLGPLGYHASDLVHYLRRRMFRPEATDAQLAEVRAWFARRAPLRAGAGPAFGAARGRNLIVVQVESMQDFVVDYRVGGQDVMPHLRRWSDEALRFTNVTDQTSEGRTSDAEFTTLVSLLPADHGAAAFQYPGNHYVGLPRVLHEQGYATLSAVPFESGFWNRRVMHPSYGFERSLFEPDFVMTEQIGWGLNDHDFLQQMVPHLERMPRPFCAWLITLSLHHPFESFPDAHKELKLGALEGTSFGNYLHTMRFFDHALEDFKAALARDGLLDTSVLVVFGDHDAGFPSDPGTAATLGVGSGPMDWALHDRIPLFVRVPGEANGLRGPRALPAGQTDFAPTLLALLGVDPAPLPYVGRNLLGAPGDPPVLRPYGDWLDAAHFFTSASGDDEAHSCFAIALGAFADPSTCADADRRARREREVARLVVTEDLQQRIRAR